jgi:hypothetical protein
MLAYIDDFLENPTDWCRAATAADCVVVSRRLDIIRGFGGRIMEVLGIEKHWSEAVWGEGAKVVDHLSFRWDSVRMSVRVPTYTCNDTCIAYSRRVQRHL